MRCSTQTLNTILLINTGMYSSNLATAFWVHYCTEKDKKTICVSLSSAENPGIVCYLIRNNAPRLHVYFDSFNLRLINNFHIPRFKYSLEGQRPFVLLSVAIQSSITHCFEASFFVLFYQLKKGQINRWRRRKTLDVLKINWMNEDFSIFSIHNV